MDDGNEDSVRDRKPRSPDRPADEIQVLRDLRSDPSVIDAIDESDGDSLTLQKSLRERFPAELVRAALGLVDARSRAAAKFPEAKRLWADRVLVEQATAPEIAKHKAQRFEGRVIDLCCGLGSDTLALARRGNVLAVDASLRSCLFTKWNTEDAGLEYQVQITTALAESINVGGRLIHLDPDQRAGGKRSRRVEHLSPSLAEITRLMASARGGAVKLSPASNFGGKFIDAEHELISLNGECKEAVIWFGELAEPDLWRATILPENATLEAMPLQHYAERSSLQRFLYDPNPAVVRAGLIDCWGERDSLCRLDDADEYLTSDRAIDSAFGRSFEVLAELPNNETKLRREVARLNWGDAEIKCRHLSIDARAIRSRLSLKPEGERGTVIFARIGGRARIVLARRLPKSSSQ
ncbi:class I SAM-dependent methyltransferase [Stratiformator vulcanicus]|uniref:THUMP-like domain-containing protein n=1 Tax=Stratiformator vulcanicus TaxID=2527980 RepID=A0A517R2F6_9PLAN|nr:hypothetical protein [Stratiformator vulcanicus]QDT38041.1 hypothetical protein Pan189_24260 [Stratiformator vulcanicus]